jgi:hypothetical protein
MSHSDTLLSSLLTHVGHAVFSTQKQLDKFAQEPTGDLPLAPLLFVVKQTQVTVLGNLSLRRSESDNGRDRALTFALVNRVQAGLRGQYEAATSSRISVSIQALEPPHGVQGQGHL